MWYNPFLFILGILAIVFSVPLVAIITEHRRKLFELQQRMRAMPSEQTTSEIRQLAREVAELRDTATQYDLSFDTALQRLESRMENVETRLGRLESGAAGLASNASLEAETTHQ